MRQARWSPIGSGGLFDVWEANYLVAATAELHAEVLGILREISA